MSKTEKLLVGFAALCLLASLGFVTVVHANPSFFATGIAINNSSATTSVAYIGPGKATTTMPVYDAYAQTQAGFSFKADKAGLLLQFSASTTAAVLNAQIEYSQGADGLDCVTTPASCDWYRNYATDPTQVASTSPLTIIANPYSLTWTFASSTIAGSTTTLPLISRAALMIPTPFRYTRIVFTVTGASSTVWAQLVPVKEQR